MSGNRDNFDKRVRIINIPFFFKFKKGELEKTFNTKRMKLSQSRIKVEKSYPNYSYNRKVKGQEHRLETKEDEYKVSSDVIKPLFKYLIKEFQEQYPQLKNVKYKGYMSIKSIEDGVPPTKKYIHVKSKYDKDLTHDLKVGENEKEIRKKLSQMTKKEYDEYSKSKKKELYKPVEKKRKKFKEDLSKRIDKLLKKNNINLEPTKFEPYGFSLDSVSEYGFRLQFMGGEDLEGKVKKFIQEDLSPYKLEHWHVRKGYSDDGKYFALLKYDTQVNERKFNTLCVDCGGNTEAFFVNDRIWYDNVPSYKQKGSMCLKCLEKRLGRSLTKSDFKHDDANNEVIHSSN